MSGIYGAIAPYYDAWNADLDYSAWARDIDRTLRAHYPAGVASVLDLGCGSGRMTVELARLGYDMIGVDLSPEMLSLAREGAEAAGVGESCLWLLQDIRSFELYGTVEAVVCCLDTVNHLTSYADLRKALALVRNYLVPDGLFLFDLNSREKFETAYADNVYTFEDDGVFCIWQNEYRPRTHVADFYVTLFKENGDGTYDRTDELTRERMYPTASIRRELAAAGFELLSVGGAPYTDTCLGGEDRLFFVARAKK